MNRAGSRNDSNCRKRESLLPGADPAIQTSVVVMEMSIFALECGAEEFVVLSDRRDLAGPCLYKDEGGENKKEDGNKE